MDASASHLKGEIDGIMEMKANNLQKASSPSNKSPSSPCVGMLAPSTHSCIPSPPPASEFAPDEPPTEKRICKPSQNIVDLLEGEGQAYWMMATDFATEYPLVVKISETEAFEPCTLAEAKHPTDWPL